MVNLTEEERERARQEQEWAKEEKLRAAEQRKLEAEKAARRAAARRSVSKVASEGARAARNAAGSASSASKKLLRRSRGGAPKAAAAFSRAAAAADRFFAAVWRALTGFAAKAYAAPLFILAVMAAYAGIARLCGFSLFRLVATPPTYQFYVCDYSVGYCSRLFVGAVISLFTDKVSIDLMNRIINVSVVLSLVGQAVIAGLLLRTGLKNRSLPAAAIGLLMMTNPLAVVENMSAPGLLDVYLLLLFLVWLAFLKTPLAAVVTPVFCLVGMAIHYEFLFSFLPPMLCLLLYDAFNAKKKRVRIGRWLAFTGGSTVSAASFFYFVFLAKDHLRLTSEAFYRHMLSRFSLSASERDFLTFVMGGPLYRDYFDYYIFGEYKGYDYFNNINDFFVFLKNWTSGRFNAGMLRKDLILFLPVLLVTAVIWIRCAKREKGIRRLPYVCFIGQSLVLIPELIISTDIWRWVSAALLAQFFVFAVVYLDKDAPLHRTADNTKVKPAVGGVFAVCTAAYVIYGLSLVN